MKSGHKVTAYGTKRVKRERNKNENSAEEPRCTLQEVFDQDFWGVAVTGGVGWRNTQRRDYDAILRRIDGHYRNHSIKMTVLG